MDEHADDPRWWLREHGPKLVLLARQFVDCHADAEDAFQEAFVRFWQQRSAAREPLAYLYRCVRNAARNRRRAEGRRRHHEQHASAERMFAGGDAEARGGILYGADDVATALAALPEEQREVVVMKVWGELTFETIGRVLEIPQGTAQSRYRYALQALRKTLVERGTQGR
jgi:RNA polymerase sigma-70 factor (ECF subfamily)